MGRVSRSRTVALVAFALSVLAFAGCSAATSVPAPPSASELRMLISRAYGQGSDGYGELGVDLVRFVEPSAWARVMTACVRDQGITGVDFTDTGDPYWGLAPAEGSARFSRALGACNLQYPLTTIKPLLLTDARWRYEFAYLSGPFAACVQHAGGEYSPPRSFGAFLANAHGFRLPSPFDSMRTPRSGLSLRALAEICPSQAPELG